MAAMYTVRNLLGLPRGVIYRWKALELYFKTEVASLYLNVILSFPEGKTLNCDIIVCVLGGGGARCALTAVDSKMK